MSVLSNLITIKKFLSDIESEVNINILDNVLSDLQIELYTNWLRDDNTKFCRFCYLTNKKVYMYKYRYSIKDISEVHELDCIRLEYLKVFTILRLLILIIGVL